MTGVMTTLIFDGILILLLGVAIFYGVKLNNRIRMLQDSRSELAEYVIQFDEATQRATANIMEIQNASKKITQNIEMKLEKANYLADDLTFLIERGIRLADQLEGSSSSTARNAGSQLKRRVREAEKELPPLRAHGTPEPKRPPSTLESMLKKAGVMKSATVTPLKSQAERELQKAVASANTSV